MEVLPCRKEALQTAKNTYIALQRGNEGFCYYPNERKIVATSKKEYRLCKDGTPTVRLFADKRSLEFFVNGEICLTYFATPETQPLKISGVESIKATEYTLESIWNK